MSRPDIEKMKESCDRILARHEDGNLTHEDGYDFAFTAMDFVFALAAYIEAKEQDDDTTQKAEPAAKAEGLRVAARACDAKAGEHVKLSENSTQRGDDSGASERLEKAHLYHNLSKEFRRLATEAECEAGDEPKRDRLNELVFNAIVPEELRPETPEAIDAMLNAMEAEPFSEEKIQRMLRKIRGAEAEKGAK
ncbi:hypothetical protein LCGC14_3166740 [marine sediment metagenome]|uniref:Uncharacterized protein n=1 Tax=marine sediment metagenome TaxID=412755 RepID=A0A0F8VJQ4_9ZZZZ